MKELSAMELHALMVAGKKAAKRRDELQEGQHQIDLTVRLRGALQVGGDRPQVKDVEPAAAVLLGLVLHQLGPKSLAAVVEEVADRCAEYVGGGDAPELSDEEKRTSERLLRRVRRQEEKTYRGAVTGVLTVEPVKKSRAA